MLHTHALLLHANHSKVAAHALCIVFSSPEHMSHTAHASTQHCCHPSLFEVSRCVLLLFAHLVCYEQGELVSQLREVVRAREMTIAHLHSEQQQAGIMLEAVRAERDRLQHEVCALSFGLDCRLTHAFCQTSRTLLVKVVCRQLATVQGCSQQPVCAAAATMCSKYFAVYMAL